MSAADRVRVGSVYRIDRRSGVTWSLPPQPVGTQRRERHGLRSARPAAGLELLGEYRDSGFVQPRYLVRRGDGQVLQLTRLLYLVIAAVDAATDLDEVAARVSLEFGRTVTADNVEYLLVNNLVPLGIVSPADTDDGPGGSATEPPRSDLVLGLKADRVLLPARVVAVLARGLSLLHRPVVVGAVLAACVVFDVWLFFLHGAITPLLGVFTSPEAILGSLGLSLVGMLFHELGHASACRYSGGRPGPIGVGIYLIWPAAYTDVSDVYRLGRAGRLRTDLGGVYFNAIFILAMAASYQATGQAFFLAVAVLSHLDIIRQFIPIFRLDGYYILGDVVGVPELFGKVRPVLASLLPGRRRDPQVTGLRRGTRITITVWVLATTAVLATYLGYLLAHLPQLSTAVAGAVARHWTAASAAWAGHHLAEAALASIRLLLLLLPFIGLAYALSRPVSRLLRYLTPLACGRTARRTTAMRRRRRTRRETQRRPADSPGWSENAARGRARSAHRRHQS